jgi:hypothetical protein
VHLTTTLGNLSNVANAGVVNAVRKIAGVAATAIAAAMFVCCGSPGGGLRTRAGQSAQAPRAVRENENYPRVVWRSPARVVPDVTSTSAGLVDVLPDGSRRMLVEGIRLLDHPDGSIERAGQLLASGNFRALDLPPRLGGGVLVAVTSRASTQIWRAKSFLADLEPLAEIWQPTLDIVAGFDRIYAILPNDDPVAIDPFSGLRVSAGPMPSGPRIRSLAFADAWRAVAVVDYLGALTTFDAGASWHKVALQGHAARRATVLEGNFVIDTDGGAFVLGPSGEIGRAAGARSPPVSAAGHAGEGARTAAAPAVPQPQVRRPLRAAVEDGWPLDPEVSVVAHAQALFRVRLADGAILQSRESPLLLPGAPCHAIAVRESFGFLCGNPMGPTAVYGFEPPLSVRELLRFSGPRVVVPSGNGALVVHGSCARDRPASAAGEASTFCVFSRSGEEREVTFAVGEKAAHPARPVVLADGSVLFLVPDGGSAAGKLVGATADGKDARPLVADPAGTPLDRAVWLEGIEQRDRDALGAWVVLGGSVRGVRVALDGRVEVGPSGRDMERTVVAGRFGLSSSGGGRGYETVDGGMHWTPVALASQDLPRPARDVAACSPVGCAIGSLLRIGWGADASLVETFAPRPPPAKSLFVSARPIALRCAATGDAADPPGHGVASARPSPAAASSAAAGRGKSVAPSAARGSPLSAWTAFRGAPAPALGPSDLGLQVGTDPPALVQARVYLWGPKGADWSQAGRWQAKFDDRFDLPGLRATPPTRAIWPDEARAADSLGLGSSPIVSFYAMLDPSGKAAVVVGRRGIGRADLYGVAAGEPPTRWRGADGGVLPDPASVVRADSVWFFTAIHPVGPSANQVTLFRVDAGVARPLARLNRPVGSSGDAPARLVRRTRSGAIGLLVQGAPAFGQSVRDWYVLPVDRDTGEVGQPIRLVGSDLEGRAVVRCDPDAEGWIVDTFLSISPSVRVLPPLVAAPSSIELRLRLDPGQVCVDAIAARGDGLVLPARRYGRSIDERGAIPMAVTDPASGRRWALRCAADPS